MLALTAGATVAHTILPLAAKAAPLYPDAELIEIGRKAAPLIAEFRATLHAFLATPTFHPDLAEIGLRNIAQANRIDILADQALKLRAHTLAGLAVKARLLRHALLVDQNEAGEFVAASYSATVAMDLAQDAMVMGAVA
jgi:hypothetical protein